MPSSASSTTVVLSAFVTAVFAALIAFATLPAVASLFSSAALTDGVASSVIVPVTAETLPVASSTLMVVLSVSTDTPPSRLIPPLSFAFTDTPLLSTVTPVPALTVKPSAVFSKPLLSATFAETFPSAPTSIVLPSVFTDTPLLSTVTPVPALIETLLFAETEIPSPAVTGVLPPAAPPPCGCSALIVTMCLPVSSVVLVTVTPSPLNSTSSPLFTVEAAPPFAETFQPKSFNALDKSPALTSFFLFPSSGAVTLPLVTLRSMVSGTSLLSFPIVNPSPCFTLNLAERPSWSIVIPPSSRR